MFKRFALSALLCMFAGLLPAYGAVTTPAMSSQAVIVAQSALPPLFDTASAAQAHCPKDTVVWLNIPSGIYHYKGERWYGRTKHGAYACEKEAIKAGDRASEEMDNDRNRAWIIKCAPFALPIAILLMSCPIGAQTYDGTQTSEPTPLQACPNGVEAFEKARALQPWTATVKGNTYLSSFELGYIRGLYLRASGSFAACAREATDPHAHDWLVLLSLETAMPPDGIVGAASIGYLRGATLSSPKRHNLATLPPQRGAF